jgi:hypothetical protein
MNKTFFKEDVFEILSDKEWHTIGELSSMMGCSVPTTRKMIRELLDDEFMILAGPSGVKMIEKDDISEETADEVIQMIGWAFAMVGAMARRMVPTKKMLPSIKKQLPKTMKERQFLRAVAVRITHVIDWQNFEDDLEM